MNPALVRGRMLAATVLLKILTPYLAKYGVALNIDDVENILIVLALAWHEAAPVLERFIPPPKSSPAQPAKESP